MMILNKKKRYSVYFICLSLFMISDSIVQIPLTCVSKPLYITSGGFRIE